MADEQPRARITIRDIAQATGWHHTTISLGLRNSPKLRAETRSKIKKMAEKLGYIPDPMLSALNAYRQKKRTAHYQATLAWINNWPHRNGLLEVATFRKYYEGACDRAGQLGYAVEEFWLHDPGVSESRFLSILKARNIQGLLLPPQPQAGADLPLNCRDLSVVAFGYSLQPPVFNVVTNHHFHTMNLMISRLIQLGYKRIGFYSPISWDERVEKRLWHGPEILPIGKIPN